MPSCWCYLGFPLASDLSFISSNKDNHYLRELRRMTIPYFKFSQTSRVIILIVRGGLKVPSLEIMEGYEAKEGLENMLEWRKAKQIVWVLSTTSQEKVTWRVILHFKTPKPSTIYLPTTLKPPISIINFLNHIKFPHTHSKYYTSSYKRFGLNFLSYDTKKNQNTPISSRRPRPWS